MSARSNHTNRVPCGSGVVSVTIFDEKYLEGDGQAWISLELRRYKDYIVSFDLDCTPEKLREIAAMLIKSADEIDALQSQAEKAAA